MGGVSRVAAGWRRWATPRAGAAVRPGASGDAGFTLIEVVVSIALIGVVMASLSTFYVSSLATTNAQSGRQGAIQLALDAMELARSVDATDLLIGRSDPSTAIQWATAPASIAPHLAGMNRAWSGGTGAAKLPTTPRDISAGGVTYQQHWFVGICWQPSANDTTCATGQPPGSVQMLRVLVAVTWPERSCPAEGCSYTVATLVSPAMDDPVFNANSTAPPTVTPPLSQTSLTGSPIAPLQVVGSGGAPPLTWSSANMPPGLSINAGTGLITGTPTTVGVYANVTITLRDSLARDATITFIWTINAPAPVLDPVADQESTRGRPVTALQLTVAGGAMPLSWSATALPPGLSINAGTGLITGTPTMNGSRTVTATVRDNQGRTSSETFTWTLNPPPALTNPGTQRTVAGQPESLQMRVNGGTVPLSWSASGLPAGLSINAGSGLISGTVTQPRSNAPRQPRVTVTDARGATTNVTFNWYVD